MRGVVSVFDGSVFDSGNVITQHGSYSSVNATINADIQLSFSAGDSFYTNSFLQVVFKASSSLFDATLTIFRSSSSSPFESKQWNDTTGCRIGATISLASRADYWQVSDASAQRTQYAVSGSPFLVGRGHPITHRRLGVVLPAPDYFYGGALLADDPPYTYAITNQTGNFSTGAVWSSALLSSGSGYIDVIRTALAGVTLGGTQEFFLSNSIQLSSSYPGALWRRGVEYYYSVSDFTPYSWPARPADGTSGAFVAVKNPTQVLVNGAFMVFGQGPGRANGSAPSQVFSENLNKNFTGVDVSLVQ